MWAIEASPGPKVAYRGGGIILLPTMLLMRP